MTSRFPHACRAAAVVAAALALGSCSNSSTGPRAATIHVLPGQLWLRLADSVQLTATAVTSDSAQLSASITFSVSDTTIAQVTASGLLHARHKVGHATITASGAGTEVQVPLTVTGTPVGILLLPSDTTITEGATLQFHAFVRDSINDTVPYRTITFASGDTTIAQVTSGGLATGVGGGGPVLLHAASGLLGGDALLSVRDSNLLASIAIANAPYSVTVSPSGLASVTSISAGLVHQINVATRTVTDSMAIGGNNVQIRLSASGDTAYLSDRQTGKLYRFRWSTHAAIDSVSLGADLYGLAVTPSGEAFTGSGSGGFLYSVSFGGTTDSAVIAPPVFQMALGGDTLLYVSNPTSPQVLALAQSTLAVRGTYLSGVGKPQQMVASPDGTELYVADENGPLRIVSLASGSQVDSVITGGGTFSVALSTDGATLYAGTSFGMLVVINRTTRAIKHRVTIGGQLRCIAVDPVSGVVVIANEGLGQVNIAR